MSNAGQPTIGPGATGDIVARAQRALRRTPRLDLAVDGVYGPSTEAAVQGFQQEASLAVDGVVGPQTWAALPDGGSMPALEKGVQGTGGRPVAERARQRCAGTVEDDPRPDRRTLRRPDEGGGGGLPNMGQVPVDGVVGDRTWSVPLHALSLTLETAVGLDHIAG